MLPLCMVNKNFHSYLVICIIIILFVHKNRYIKHIDKTSEQDNKALRSALTAAIKAGLQKV